MHESSGPGVRTADGCSVELYRRLPYLGDLDPIRPLLAPGSSILELGAGAGRLTRTLLAWGLVPTANDSSADMLRHVPEGVATICSRIQDLAVPAQFDAVLLASCLINHPESGARRSFVACAARHLRDGGQFFLERHDPSWLENAAVGPVGTAGGAQLSLDRIERTGETVRMCLRYATDGQEWTHDFVAVPLSESQIEQQLAAFGFGQVRWHGSKRRWLSASLKA